MSAFVAACIAGALACAGGRRPPSFSSLMASAWIEEDSGGIVGTSGSTVQFLEGFAVPGDSGWALKGVVAWFSLRSVSTEPRNVVIDLSVPPPSGRVRVLDNSGTTLYDSLLAGGEVSAHITLGGSPPPRGTRMFKLRWDPGDSRGPAARRLVVRDVRVTPVESNQLATVTYDSTSNTLVMGPGCTVRIHVRPARGARISGQVAGSDGSVWVSVRTDMRGRVEVWRTQLRGPAVPFSLDFAKNRADSLAEITLETSRTGRGAVWSQIALSGVAASPYVIPADHVPPRGPICVPGKALNVILYLVDTVRRDHMQPYGYDLPTTPGLAADLSSWCVFENCQSLSSWTKASTASLLTGLSPIGHRAVDEDDVLPADVELIWEPFRRAGYATALLTTNGHISGSWGFRRSTDYYRYFKEDPGRPSLHCPADSIHAALLDWLDRRADSKPFFAYMHATDPHIPYTPPLDLIPLFYPPGIPTINEVSVRRLSQMMCPGKYEPWELEATRALYDAEIAGWDRSFTSFLEALRRRGYLQTTAIVLTSDHGEEFAEHGGFSHGTTLYGEQVRIPLLARVPGCRGGRSAIPIDHRDVVDLIRWVVEGSSPLRWSPSPRLQREAHLSLRGISMARLQGSEFSAIWNARPVGICDRRLREMELYAEVQTETKEVSAGHPATTRACRAALASWVKRLPSARRPAVVLDQENIERLRILGYMTDDLSPE